MARSRPIPFPEPVIKTFFPTTDFRGNTPIGKKAFMQPVTVK